jgi:hypothetical protein
MKIPPAIVDLKVDSPTRNRPLHVWLPVFLLWPLFLAIGALALVFTAIADVALLLAGRRYHHYTILVARSLALVCETRGTTLRFSDGRTAVDLTVQ